MSDITEQLRCLYVWPQSIADHHADILTPRQVKHLYDVGTVADVAIAEINTLRERVRLLEIAAVTAVLPLEAIRMSGADAAHCQDVRDAISDGINTVRQVISK